MVAPEIGMTGMREAIWAHKASGSEGMNLLRLQDRLRARYGGSGLTRLPADDEEWDSMFPDHPLSRVRRYLSSLAPSIVLAERAKGLAPFG